MSFKTSFTSLRSLFFYLPSPLSNKFYFLVLLVINSLRIGVIASIYPVAFSILDSSKFDINQIYFGIAAIIVCLFTRVFLLYQSEKFSASAGNFMSKLLYESVLTRDYLAFSSIPKSDYLSTFSYVSPLIRNQFQPAINAFQSTIFALSIFVLLSTLGFSFFSRF